MWQDDAYSVQGSECQWLTQVARPGQLQKALLFSGARE
jgi:hypothetical protein